MNTWFWIDFPLNLFGLGVSTIPQIEKTCSLGVDVAGTLYHIRAHLATLGYICLFFFHHSRGLISAFGYITDSVSAKYNNLKLISIIS